MRASSAARIDAAPARRRRPRVTQTRLPDGLAAELHAAAGRDEDEDPCTRACRTLRDMELTESEAVALGRHQRLALLWAMVCDAADETEGAL